MSAINDFDFAAHKRSHRHTEATDDPNFASSRDTMQSAAQQGYQRVVRRRTQSSKPAHLTEEKSDKESTSSRGREESAAQQVYYRMVRRRADSSAYERREIASDLSLGQIQQPFSVQPERGDRQSPAPRSFRPISEQDDFDEELSEIFHRSASLAPSDDERCRTPFSVIVERDAGRETPRFDRAAAHGRRAPLVACLDDIEEEALPERRELFRPVSQASRTASTSRRSTASFFSPDPETTSSLGPFAAQSTPSAQGDITPMDEEL